MLDELQVYSVWSNVAKVGVILYTDMTCKPAVLAKIYRLTVDRIVTPI